MNFHHHPHCVLTEEFRFFLDLDLCCNIVKKWPYCAWLFASQSTSLYFTLPLSFTSSTPTLPHTTPSSVSLLGFTPESVWLIHGLQAQMDCRWICCADGMSIYFAWVIMLMCFFFPCAIWSIIFRWWCWYYIDKEQVFCCLSKEPLCNQATEKKCAIHHYWDNSFQHHQRDQITGAEMQNVGSFKQTARMCPSVSVWSDLKGFSSQCQGECAVSAFAVQKWAASIVHGSRRGGGEWEPSADMKQDSCGCL